MRTISSSYWFIVNICEAFNLPVPYTAFFVFTYLFANLRGHVPRCVQLLSLTCLSLSLRLFKPIRASIRSKQLQDLQNAFWKSSEKQTAKPLNEGNFKKADVSTVISEVVNRLRLQQYCNTTVTACTVQCEPDVFSSHVKQMPPIRQPGWNNRWHAMTKRLGLPCSGLLFFSLI